MMIHRLGTLALGALLLASLAACAGTPTATPVPATPTTLPTEVPAATPDLTPEPMAEPTGVAADASTPEATAVPAAALPDWQTATLTNAVTGETFTLADFAGRTVYVEPFATWCTTCRVQLRNLQDARATLGTDDYVYVVLSVETNVSNAQLAEYVARHNFPYTFAVLNVPTTNALVRTFGRTITNPPATPHFIILPDGTHTPLFSGQVMTADALVALLQNPLAGA